MKPKKPQTRLVDKKDAFLAAFVATANLTEAAAAVGIDRGQHYDWLRTDPRYAQAFEDIKPQVAQTLKDSAVDRALKGVFVPLVYQGKFQYPQEQYEISPAVPAGDWKDENPTEAKAAGMGWRDVPGAPPLGLWVRSESLHLALLRAHCPEFRANGTLELTGKDGGPIPIEEKRLANLTNEELAALIAVAKKLAVDPGDGGGTGPSSAE